MMPSITDDHAAVVRVLAAAFMGDPVMAWLFDDPTTHVHALDTWWTHLVGMRPDGSELWIDGGSAAAMWHPPRLPPPPEMSRDGARHPDATSRDATAGDDEEPAEDQMSPFVAMVAGLVGERLPEVLTFFGRVASAHPDEPHWYLPAVGTVPAAQGRGAGAALLQPMLHRCDAQGLPAYLESSNPRNLAFYHRLGFEITGEIWTPDDTTVMTAMWRRPAM